MDNSRPFVPGFMKKIDRSLLLNSPTVWSMRTHLVLFFGLCFAVALALLCALLYSDARTDSNAGIMTGFVIVIAAIGLIFWLIYLLRFNVFKRYGEWKTGDGLKIFFLLFFNVSIFVSLPFIPVSVETFMANRQFSDKEMINDVNEINISVARLEYSGIDKKWNVDTATIGTSGSDGEMIYPAADSPASVPDTVISVSSIKRNRNIQITKEDLASRQAAGDSIIKADAGKYLIYEGPDLRFLYVYNLKDGNKNEVLGSRGIYNAAIRNYSPPDKEKLTQRLQELKKKYHTDGSDYYSYSYSNDYSPENKMSIIRQRYHLDEISSGMSFINNKKDTWEGSDSWAFRILYYCTLFFTLLIFIFRHSTPKTFFLTALSAIVLAIITGLFIAVSDGREGGILIAMIFYFVVFALISFTLFSAPVRSLWRGIALNLFMFALPVMPLVITAYYWFTGSRRYLGSDSVDYDLQAKSFFYAEIAGLALLIILIEPLFRRLYRAWYAAPEE